MVVLAAELLASSRTSTRLSLHPQLPNVGLEDKQWNVKPCHAGRGCRTNLCKYYHSLFERRCSGFSSGSCSNAMCEQGLHVWPNEVQQVISVHLDPEEDPSEPFRFLGLWKMQPAQTRACVVRLEVQGFAGVRKQLLIELCCLFPLLHELSLPDRKREPNLLVYLADVCEKTAEPAPRLQKVIFEDGTVEHLWD